MQSLYSLLTFHFAAGFTGCKNKPGSAGWPQIDQWNALNRTVGGRLIKTVPPGGVCHAGQPNYNAAACNLTAGAWLTEDFHAQNPFSFDYNDDTCYPDVRAPCSATGYPVYVVDARAASDIQASVRFAQRFDVRLVVKGTGHDFNFRSNAPNSLRIWTHNLQKAEFTKRSGGSVTLGAGMQWGNVYKLAEAQNVEVVGGSDPTVGVGGFLGGGGHGPLTGTRGLGADNVLDYEVVTPDGELKICNAQQNDNLFWALRGGGASTFAVVVSVTLRTYPRQNVIQWGFAMNTTGNGALWDATTYFHTQLPQLNEAGLTSYYFVTPAAPGGMGSLSGIFLSYGEVNATLVVQPLVKAMNSGPWRTKLSGYGYAGISSEFPSILAYTNGYKHTETVGFDGRLGSRLLCKNSLTANPGLRKALEATTPPGSTLLGHLVAGKGVREARPEGGNAVLPAWRKSYVHLVVPAKWTLLNATERTAATAALREQRVQALRDLAPDIGSYMSEGDPTEPNWQHTFWGANYPKLLSLKRKYDPKGLFYCLSCVGSEFYEERDGLCVNVNHASDGNLEDSQ